MTTDATTLLAHWSRRMRAEGLADRTTTERPRIIARAAAEAGAHPAQLTTAQLVDYLADLPSASTRQTYYGALTAWHQWLLAEDIRADNPMVGLRRPRAPRRTAHPVSTTHIDRLLRSGIRRRTRTAVLLCAYQGLRVHEAAKVRGQDVDLLAHTLRVVGKGGGEEVLPLHPIIAAEAAVYPRRGYWFPSHSRPGRPVRGASLSSAISRAMERASIPGTAHSLRHWHATELVRSGVNARVIQTLMRHASLATMQIYTLVDRDQQRAALHLLPALGSVQPFAERTAS
jgi:site-specific recombinase XerD